MQIPIRDLSEPGWVKYAKSWAPIIMTVALCAAFALWRYLSVR